jgi:predicted PurR-regulated permease PerM
MRSLRPAATILPVREEAGSPTADQGRAKAPVPPWVRRAIVFLLLGAGGLYIGPRLRRTVCSVLPPDRQQLAMRIWELATESTGGYVYSRALLAGVSATATTLFLALVGVPYPFALGIWVGLVSQFVPAIGTYLAGALPVLIALFHDPVDAVWVLLFITLYQQFENLVLSPRITARTMSLHPAVAFGAVIAGGAILGRSEPSWPCRRRPASRRWFPCTFIATRWSPAR